MRTPSSIKRSHKLISRKMLIPLISSGGHLSFSNITRQATLDTIIVSATQSSTRNSLICSFVLLAFPSLVLFFICILDYGIPDESVKGIGQNKLVIPTCYHHTALVAPLSPGSTFVCGVKKPLFASCQNLLPVVG